MKLKKKFILLCTLIIISILLIGCNYNINDLSNIIFNPNKPNNFYYTNILAKNLALETSCKVTILDTNFYKEKELNKDNINIIRYLLKNLNKNNFISKPKALTSKPIYKIYLTFSKDKFVINVYSDKYIAIYPWDGNYPMDYIDMKGIPASLNLYSLCKYLFN
jgi:hypothetical protein